MRLPLAFTSLTSLAILASLNVSASARHDEGIGFYVGDDGLAIVASGTNAGLSNPNAFLQFRSRAPMQCSWQAYSW